MYDVDSPVILQTDLIGYVDVSQEQLLNVAEEFKNREIDIFSQAQTPVKHAEKWNLSLPMTNTDRYFAELLKKKDSSVLFFVQKYRAIPETVDFLFS